MEFDIEHSFDTVLSDAVLSDAMLSEAVLVDYDNFLCDAVFSDTVLAEAMFSESEAVLNETQCLIVMSDDVLICTPYLRLGSPLTLH